MLRSAPRPAGSRSGSTGHWQPDLRAGWNGAQLTYEVDAGAGLQPLGTGPGGFRPGPARVQRGAVISRLSTRQPWPDGRRPYRRSGQRLRLERRGPGGLGPSSPARERRFMCNSLPRPPGAHRLAGHCSQTHTWLDGLQFDLRSGRGAGLQPLGAGPGGFRLGPSSVQRRAPFSAIVNQTAAVLTVPAVAVPAGGLRHERAAGPLAALRSQPARAANFYVQSLPRPTGARHGLL